jgi:histidinol phosphatase-like enzyme
MRIFKCNSCSRIHLEIANTQIHFSSLTDLELYLKTLDSIDTAYYAAVNRKKGLTKVIILPLNNTGNIQMGFTEQEFEELKSIIRDYLSKYKAISSIYTAGFVFGGWEKEICPN